MTGKERKRIYSLVIGLILAIGLFLMPVAPVRAMSAPELAVWQVTEAEDEGVDTSLFASRYRLTAADDSCPMPDGAEEGEFLFTLSGNDSFVFSIFLKDDLRPSGQDAGAENGSAAICFESAGLYQYTLSQLIPEQPDRLERDTTIYRIFVYVKQGEKPEIDAVWAELENGEKQESIDFINRVRKQKVIGDPPVPVVKRVEGDIPSKKDPFVFAMVPVREGDPLPYGASGRYEVTQYGPGEIEIGNIEFEDTGVYEYTVSEVKGNTEGYTYDETVYRVIYTVRQREDGTLACDRQILKKEQPVNSCSFSNKYKNPSKSSPGKGTSGKSQAGPVKTGDGSRFRWFLVLFILSSGAFSRCVGSRRRRPDRSE